MSITFHPQVNFNKDIPLDKPVWTASWIQHCKWDELPDKFKAFYQEMGGDVAQKFWEMDTQVFQTWVDIARKLGLMLYEDYPFKKAWVDSVPWKVSMIAYGEHEEHIGMEMTLANENAHALCQMLRIDDSGSSHPLALLKKIEAFTQSNRASEFTKEESDTQFKDPNVPLGLGDGPRVIEFGRDENKIRSYLLHLENICDHCIKHECNVSWG